MFENICDFNLTNQFYEKKNRKLSSTKILHFGSVVYQQF